MNFLYFEYLPILLFIFISFLLGLIIFGLSRLIADQAPDAEKVSAYECGFDPFDDARNTFDVRFYLVAILFIVFDREATFIFPWALTVGELSAGGFWTIVDFLVERTVGFLYIWKVGSLEWD